MQNNITSKELGSRFARIRSGNGYSQEQVAKFLGYKDWQIDDFEHGRGRLNNNELQKACNLFGITVEKLCADEKNAYMLGVNASTTDFRYYISYFGKEELDMIAHLNKRAREIREKNKLF